MKVELLVNLKVSTGKIISAGSVFSDEEGAPIPEFVMRRLQRRQARIIPGSKPIAAKALPSTLIPKGKKEKAAISASTTKPVIDRLAVGQIPKAIGKKGMDYGGQ
jgi:hypothetical protein